MRSTRLIQATALIVYLLVACPSMILCRRVGELVTLTNSSLPYGDKFKSPFQTSGRWILDRDGERVKFECVHWVGHMEVGIPEGLQWQSVESIAGWINRNRFNCVRLSYSTDMVLNHNTSVQTSFRNAARSIGLPEEGVLALFENIQDKNPWVNDTTTPLQVFGKVIDALGKHNVFVILDNHLSRAGFCCSTIDGNGWFKLPHQEPGSDADRDSKYFDIQDWIESLRSMALFAKNHPNVVAMDLRNELRPVTWDTKNWFRQIDRAAREIHANNPDLLIVIGGLNYATDLSFLQKQYLDVSAYPHRVVWEFHEYSWSHGLDFRHPARSAGSCKELERRRQWKAGFVLHPDRSYTAPLWLSEFGLSIHAPSEHEQSWLACLIGFMKDTDIGWSVWTLGGSYYIRDSVINYDEPFGMLNRDWSQWRNDAFPAWIRDIRGIKQYPGD